MRYSDKDCIVIGFDEDRVHLTSVILMNGKSGLKKMIQGISGKKEMEIYHINFADKTCIEAGRVSLPQDIPAVDMVIEFKPEEDGGTVTICNTDQVWSYTVLEKTQGAEKNSMKSAVTLSQTSENETTAGKSKYYPKYPNKYHD